MKNSKNIENIFGGKALSKDDLNSEFIDGLVKMAFKLNINGRKLVEEISYKYMKHVYENVGPTKANVMAHTRFRRTVVDGFVKKYRQEKTIGLKEETSIFNEYIHKLKNTCKENNNMSLLIRGDKSCQSLFNECEFSKNNTHTYMSILKMFEKCGYLKIGKEFIKFTSHITKKKQREPDDINRQFSNMVNDYADMQIHNMDSEEDCTFYSQRIMSVDIPGSNVEDTRTTINQTLRNAHKVCFDQIEDREDEESNSKHKVVVHQFMNITKREDHEK